MNLAPMLTRQDEGTDLRQRLIAHIEGGEAFLNIEHVLDRIPFDRLGERPPGMPYSFYEQFYHICVAQKDLLEYSLDSFYASGDWPEDFWPDNVVPADRTEWEGLKETYFSDRKAFQELLKDLENDLHEPFRNGSGHTLFRQAMLLIEHGAYHTGQLWAIMRSLGLHN